MQSPRKLSNSNISTTSKLNNKKNSMAKSYSTNQLSPGKNKKSRPTSFSLYMK